MRLEGWDMKWEEWGRMDVIRDRSRAQAVQGMTHLDLTWRMVVTCSRFLERSLRLLCGKWMEETELSAASYAEGPVAWSVGAEKQGEGWMVDSPKKQSPCSI